MDFCYYSVYDATIGIVHHTERLDKRSGLGARRGKMENLPKRFRLRGILMVGSSAVVGTRKPGNYPGYQVPMARTIKQALCNRHLFRLRFFCLADHINW
jgi:hypothetical protein